ncbi:MAG: anhydro-N-acetylmuramic acid kinase [Micavibrio sp.]
MQKPSPNPQIQTAIGLMSGTSLDGIDAALIRTDGLDFVEPVAFYTCPYTADLREKLRACLGLSHDPDGRVAAAEAAMTHAHGLAVKALLDLSHMRAGQIDLIGFHGQTLFHDPANRFTWQIGDGAALARQTSIPVVNDFRTADVKAGGQGAPLIPVYHAALAHSLSKPVAILNIGGVANVTLIDEQKNVLAFDVGPGNALINDWIHRHTGEEYDPDGSYARKGIVDTQSLSRLLQNVFFEARPPKSLDRDAWNVSFLSGMGLEDGAATLTAFTVKAIALSLEHMPVKPVAWYVTGGGRLNKKIMDDLQATLGVPVKSVDELGWDGDALEAQGFAYLAVRSRLGLPLSFPTTTAVSEPMTGGRYWDAA